jgi:dipeptidyl aminopeptidase/acylaminoacyl peptidase
LYFISARDADGKDPQVYRMPMAGGESEPVTRIAGGVTLFAVSPDGGRIACVSTGTASKPRGPRDHIRIDRLAYRFDVQPGYLQDAPQAVHVVDMATGAVDRITAPDGLITALAWSPDGSQLAFVRLMGTSSDRFGHGDLCVVAPGSPARTLIACQQVQLPFWTSDGAAIGFCSPPDGDFTRQSQVFIVSAEGGTPEPRSATLDRTIPPLLQVNSPAARTPIVARAVGDVVLTMMQNGGEGRIVRLALSGPERCEPVVTGPRICRLLDVRDEHMLFTSQDWLSPPRLHLARVDGREERCIADLNAAWHASIQRPNVEHFNAQTRDGANVESWVLIPQHVPGPHKTLLYIHGGPHAAFGWGYPEDMHELVGAGYAVVCANSRGSCGYGDDFMSAITGRWGELELIDFDAVLDVLVERGITDPKRIGVMGVSGGGHLSAWLITHSERFAAAVPEQGVYSMFSMFGVADCGPELIAREMGGLPHECPEVYWRLSPVAHARNCRTPTLLIQGEDDVRCPMQQAEEFYTALKLAGCKVEFLRLKGCAHGIQMVGPPHLRRYRMDAIKDWFARHLEDAA